MAYDVSLLELRRVIPGSVIGVSLVVGTSLLGEDMSNLEPVPGMSSIELTDGYNVDSTGKLSIDPLTGVARYAERLRAAPGDPVEQAAQQHEMYTGTGWEVRYAGTTVAQGKVTRVETSISAEGRYWVKTTEYILSGAAANMLDTTVNFGALPEEGALSRLQRFFTVDVQGCRTVHLTYFNTVKAPALAAGSTTLLDLARAFTDQTGFPVRTENTHSRTPGLTIVPAVTFQGLPPPPLNLPPASEWTTSAGFLSDVVKPTFSLPAEKVQTVDVVKDYDEFIAGIDRRALEAGALGSTFRLSQTRLMRTVAPGAPDIGVRAPAVVDFFGDVKVVSQISHAFRGRHYRCSIQLTSPVEVT